MFERQSEVIDHAEHNIDISLRNYAAHADKDRINGGHTATRGTGKLDHFLQMSAPQNGFYSIRLRCPADSVAFHLPLFIQHHAAGLCPAAINSNCERHTLLQPLCFFRDNMYIDAHAPKFCNVRRRCARIGDQHIDITNGDDGRKRFDTELC